MDASDRIAYDSVRTFENKAFRSGCYAPFVSLYFNTFGDVLACCKNVTYPLGNVAHDRLADIWRGHKSTQLREALAEYRFENGCEMCEWEIAGGDPQGAFPSIFEYLPVASKEPEWPAQIEFAGSNTCNFECVMCSGEFSSSIRARRELLPPLPKVYGDQFFQDLRAFLPHLRYAKFLGGEPFLAEESFRIWDMVIEGGFSLPCHVTTNGSQYNARVERVLDALPVAICVSLDGATKETVERIRINSNFEDFVGNVRRFRDYVRHRKTSLSFAHCLMRQNWHEFGDVLRLAESMEGRVFVNTVLGPHSLYTLPPEELLRIADDMDKQRLRGEDDLRINQGIWEAQILKLRNNAHARLSERLTSLQNTMGEAWKSRAGGVINILDECWDLIRAGRHADALKAALLTPESNPYYYYSAIVCVYARRFMGDLEGAEKDLERCFKISKRRPEAFIARAWVRYDQGRLDDASADVRLAGEIIKPGGECESALANISSALQERRGVSDQPTVQASALVTLKPSDSGV